MIPGRVRGAGRLVAVAGLLAAAVGGLSLGCDAHPIDAVFLGPNPDAGPSSRVEAGAPPLADGGTDADAAPTYIWPNQVSAANSDPWIAAHHDQIVEMQPRVLLLNFANGVDPSAAQNLATQHIDAFMEASRYHGYSDPGAPAFLQYQLAKIVDLRDGSTAVNSATLPVSNGQVDYAQLNTPAFASLMAIEDPDNPGTYLDMCGLFEKGIINEVWGMVADPATVKFATSAETKQAYDDNDEPIAGQFVCTSNGPCIDQALPCKVSTRFYDFNPGRGSGCHLFDNGLVWEHYVTQGALPAFAKVAATFFNFDFDTRFGAPFTNFYQVCPTMTDTCIEWTSEVHAVSGPASSTPFDFSPMSAGCGNVSFPPNATGESIQTGDVTVLTSCENYGLHNGVAGADLTTPYSNQLAADDYANDANVATDCGGTQPTYLLASMPGLGTRALAADGTPMRNWWVYLFY